MLRAMAKIIKICFYGAIIISGVAFCVSNHEMVDLTFYPVPYLLAMPLYLLAIIIFTLGIFMGWSVARFNAGSQRRALKQAGKRIEALENELGAVRTERLIKPGATALPPK